MDKRKAAERSKRGTASQRLRSLLLRHGGMTLAQAAEVMGLFPRTIYNRLRKDDWTLREYIRLKQALPEIDPEEILEAMMTGYKKPTPDLMDLTLREIEDRAAAKPAPMRYGEMADEDFDRILQEFEKRLLPDHI